jgi:hypothetical protein
VDSEEDSVPTPDSEDSYMDEIMRNIAKKNLKQKKARLIKIKRPGEDSDPNIQEKTALKIDNLKEGEVVVPDFKRMRKGVALLYDFID